MIDFFGRLASRAVLPSVRTSTAPIVPLSPTRFATIGGAPVVPELGDRSGELREVREEVIASQPRRARRREAADDARLRSDAPIDAQVGPSPSALNDDRPRPRGVVPVVPATWPMGATTSPLRGTTDIENQDPEPIRPVVALARPVVEAPLVAAADGEEAPDRRDAVVTDVRTPSLPGMELVVEVLRVPGPIVVVEREREAATARRRHQPARVAADRSERRRDGPARAVEFQPREPLAPLGLQALRVNEVLDSAAIETEIPSDGIVHVHIGRLEVARPTPQPVLPSPPRRSGLLSLDDYLAQRTASVRGRSSR